MKRIFTLVLAMFVASASLSAQGDTQISDTYDRNGLSVIVMEHNDRYDSVVKSAFDAIDLGDKFDKNPLKKSYYKIDIERSDTSILRGPRISEMTAVVNENKLPREVISYCMMRNEGTGEMSLDRLLDRGNYNATDSDYDQAAASYLGIVELGNQGFTLLANNYIMAIDVMKIEASKNDKGEVTSWSAKSAVSVYKVEFDNNMLYAIDESFCAESLSEKKRVFASINFTASRVATVYATGTSIKGLGGSREKAVQSSYWSALSKLENTIDAWAVKSPVELVRPIRAKIGKKEGLKNGDRYFSYRYVFNERSEDVDMKRSGVVRAAKVADNRVYTSDVEGQSPMTTFAQVSGVKRVRQGDVLVQNNDLRMFVSAGYSTRDLSAVQIEYLTSINSKGHSFYTMLSVGYTPYSDVYDDWYTYYTPKVDVSAIRAGFGFGYGIRFARHFELVPSIQVGMDYISEGDNDSEEMDDETFDKYSAYVANPGLKFNINICYPVQLYVMVDYTYNFIEGEYYTEYFQYGDNYSKDYLRSSRAGLGLGAGVRISF